MPSTDADSTTDSNPTRRRALLAAAAGGAGLLGIGTLAGSRVLTEDRDEVESTRRLETDEGFDIDDASSGPPDEAEDGHDARQRCDPDPDRLRSGSHVSNLTLIDAWSERYRIFGERETDEDSGSSPNEATGVDVQNTLTLDKASGYVDGSYLYGVRLYSLCHTNSSRLSQLHLRRLENELVVDSDIEIRSVLPESPIEPDDGLCSMSFLTELDDGWTAGYEQYWPPQGGRIEADRDDETVVVSFDGDVSRSVAMKGLLELRSERPLSTFDEPFAWTVRGEASRRGL